VRTICLPTAPVKVPGYNVTASGWGRSGTGQPATDDLRKAVLQTVSDGECKSYYNINADSFFCARGVDGTICSGDSGSAVVSDRNEDYVFELDGIVSFGSSAGCYQELRVGFTRSRLLTFCEISDISWSKVKFAVFVQTSVNLLSTGCTTTTDG
jgi:hypothetical protein